MLDNDNDPLAIDYPYRVSIVSIANEGSGFLNNISICSNYTYFSLKPADAVKEVTITKTGYNCNIEDFEISFSSIGAELNVAAYRVFIFPNNYYYNVDSLLNLSPDYYIEIIPDGSSLYQVNFTADKLVVNEDNLQIFNDYRAVIVSIPDGTSASLPNTAVSSYYYPTEFYCETYPVAPVVTIEAEKLSINDAYVSFPKPINEALIDKYYVFLVPVAYANVLTPANLFLQEPEQQVIIYPVGEDIGLQLPTYLVDINGKIPDPNTEYVVKIGLKNYSFYPEYSLSLPSNVFKIPNANSADFPYLSFNNNELTFNAHTPGEYHLNIYSINGQLIKQLFVNQPTITINMSNLNPGVYIANIEEINNIGGLKFIVLNTDTP